MVMWVDAVLISACCLRAIVSLGWACWLYSKGATSSGRLEQIAESLWRAAGLLAIAALLCVFTLDVVPGWRMSSWSIVALAGLFLVWIAFDRIFKRWLVRSAIGLRHRLPDYAEDADGNAIPAATQMRQPPDQTGA